MNKHAAHIAVAAARTETPKPWAFSVPQLLALVTIATLAPMILFGAMALFLWDRNERSADLARLSAHAEALAQAVDREVIGYRELVEGIANSPDLQNGHIEGFWRSAHGIAQHIGGQFALVAPDMKQIANTNAEPGAALPQASATVEITRVFETGVTITTNFGTRALRGETQFTIVAPVRHEGRVRYVLGYAPPKDAIQSILMQTYRPDGWLAAVLDRNGTIVARSHDYEEFFGRPATASFI